MIVDHLRSCYTTTMFFFTEDFIPGQPHESLPPPSLHPGASTDDPPANAAVATPVIPVSIPVGPIVIPPNAATGSVGLFTGSLRIPIRWYWCAPDAEYFPHPTCFGSAVWDAEYEGCDFHAGEDRFAVHKWSNGRTPLTATGQGHFCGTPQDFVSGFPYGSYAGIQYDDEGIPLCCATQRGAPAGGSIGLTSSLTLASGAIGLFGLPVASPFLVLASLDLLAYGNLTLGGLVPGEGKVVFGSWPPPTGAVVVASAGVADGKVALAGLVPADGKVTLGEVPRDYGAIVLLGVVPSQGTIGFGGAGLADGSFVLSGIAPTPDGVVVGGDLPAIGSIIAAGLSVADGGIELSGTVSGSAFLVASGLVPAGDDVVFGMPTPAMGGVGLPGLVPADAGMGFS